MAMQKQSLYWKMSRFGMESRIPGLYSSVSRRDRIYLKTKVVRAGTAGAQKDAAGVAETQNDAAEDAGPQKAAAGIDGRNKTDDAWQKMLSDQSSAFMPYRPISPPGSR